jgi:hypothetical protein
MMMKKIIPVTWIRNVCHRCGQLLHIYDDTVWTDNRTYHYECWMKEKESKSWNNAGISGLQSGSGR